VTDAAKPLTDTVEPIKDVVAGADSDHENTTQASSGRSHSAPETSSGDEHRSDGPAMTSLSSGSEKPVSHAVGRAAVRVLDSLHGS